MASLNLDALKNRSTSSPIGLTSSDNEEMSIVSETAAVVAPATSEGVKKSPIKKLSLMSLKKTGEGEVIAKPMEESKTESVAQEIEKPKISLKKPQAIQEEAVLPIQEEVIVELPSEIVQEEIVSESIITKESSESFSLTIEGNDQAEKVEEIKVEEPRKEFFPKLQSLNLVDFSESVDIISDSLPTIEAVQITETPMVTSVSIPVEEIKEEPKTEEIESVILTEEPKIGMENTTTQEIVVAEEPILEEESLTILPTEEVKDKDYVEGVKTELSSQRKAGFRFFMERKTKLLAGVGIIASVWVIAILSSTFFGSTLPEGKTNIQEVVKNEGEMPTVLKNTPVTPDTETTESGKIIETPIPSIVSDEYEAGKDYSVTKNNKKNVKSKSAPIVPTP